MTQPAKENTEEQFLLRIQEPELAIKIRKALKAERELSEGLELIFEEPGREGQFHAEGQVYPVTLLDLPAVVESYKTLDDHNLVKSADIGQMLLVRPLGSEPPPAIEATDGVTPSLKNGRQRWFHPIPNVDPAVMAKVERDVLAMLSGGAPDGWQITDVEEVYEVDEATKQGSWKPVPKK